jgi:hypothetical protein
MLFVVAPADQPCRRRRQRLPSRGLTMVSLVICRRFDLLSDRTQFDLHPSLFACRRRRLAIPLAVVSVLSRATNTRCAALYMHVHQRWLDVDTRRSRTTSTSTPSSLLHVILATSSPN